MIYQNAHIAVDLSRVKAIWKEYLPDGGNLVFEFDNTLQYITHPETQEKTWQSFPTAPLKIYFAHQDSLSAYFDEWVEIWTDYKIEGE